MTGLRRSDLLLAALALLGAAAILAWVDAGARRLRLARDLEVRAAVVKRLSLTDLSLFTEAPYTRHPSQADAFAPFQDSPGAREKFPSGALLAPPPHLVGRAR